jgi:class 3 adenylate cyclase/tetratricopeptide (TPR) repeat protein
MVCPDCGTENRSTRKFCLRCGHALAVTCPACGAVNEPEAGFCGECGAPLGSGERDPGAHQPAEGRAFESAITGSAPAAPPVAERRLVTVLFADLVGFTPFAEGRDAEDVRETLSRYFELASGVIGRHGGTVEKFIGDAVMAVWGAPIAHEDDAERAVRAGLELVDAIPGLGAGMAARAGILTGEAAITLGAQGQGMVAGDLVTTASRLQSVALPGTVLVGEATMRAASRAIAFEPAGDQVLRGKTASVPAWRAGPVVAERGGRGRPDVLEPPFVGRAEELRALKEALLATGRDHRPRLVSITGPAGIGKSRLAWELEKYVDGLVEPVYWHAGRSPAHGDGVAAWALGEMVRRRAGLAEGDDEPTTRAAIGRLLAEWVPSAEDRRWVEPALLTLLGLDPAPSGGRDVLFAGWRILFEQIAARGTTVLVFEDLQWADDGLLDFVEHLLEWAKGSPILVVTLSRPELLDRRPGWGAGTRAATSLAIEPLEAADMRRLVLGLVPELPARPLATIVERAAGIPLYAVETLRMLVVDGRLEPADGAWRPTGEIADLAVPETLRSLVAARLDALDPADRSLLEDAAVLGGSFSVEALVAVNGEPADALEPRLRGLVRREFLAREVDPRSPERGQYAFVQALVREVAYGTLARADRRARHLAAARHLESLGSDEVAGALAAHYLAARRDSTGPEADALAIQARITLAGAARRALDLGAHDQAVAHVEQALSLPMSPGEEATLLDVASRGAGRAGHLAAGVDYACRALARREAEGDAIAIARAMELVVRQLQAAGRVRDAIPMLEGALARRSPNSTDEADAVLLAALARARYNVGAPPEQVLSTVERALPIAERLALDDLVTDTLVSKAGAYRVQGRRREAEFLLRGAVGSARALGNVDADGRALNNLALLLEGEDLADCVVTHRQCLELWRRLGRRSSIAFQAGNLAYSLIHAALDWDEPLHLVGELDDPDGESLDRIQLGYPALEILAARCELDDERFASHAWLVASMADPQQEALLELTRARVEWCWGDFPAAMKAGMTAADYPGLAIESLFESMRGAVWLRDEASIRSIIERLDAAADCSRYARAARAAARGALADLEGRTDVSVAEYQWAIRRLREGGFGLAAAQVALDFTFLTGPDVPEARAAAGEARVVFERVRAKVYLERLDAVLAGTFKAGAAAPGRGSTTAPVAATQPAG